MDPFAAEVRNFTTNPVVNDTVFRSDSTTITLVCFITLSAVITTVYNTLVLIAFVSDKTIRTPFNYYLINLTIADLSIAIMAMPFGVYAGLHDAWPYGEVACIWFLHCALTCTGAGAHSVMWIALDRLYALTFPIHYRQHQSTKLSVTVCLVMWLYISVMTLPFIVLHRTTHRLSDKTCTQNYGALIEYGVVVEVALFTLPLVVVSVAYLLVVIVMRRRRAEVHGSTLKDGTATASGGEQRIFLALARLVAVMLFLWSPAVIFYVMVIFDPSFYSATAAAVVLCIQHSSCPLNPFIYHHTLPEIDRAIRNLFRGRNGGARGGRVLAQPHDGSSGSGRVAASST